MIVMSVMTIRAGVDLRIEAGAGIGKGWKTVTEGTFPNLYSHPEKGVYSGGMLGAYVDIGLSKSIPLLLETGLSVGLHDGAFSKIDDDGLDVVTTLGIPVKVGYRFQFSRRSSLTVAVGPYFGFYLSSPEGYVKEPVQIGLTPSVMYRYRKFSVGLSYHNPVIYNGPRELNKNTFALTVGLTFNLNPNWGGWKYVGMGVAAVGVAAGTYAAIKSASPTETADYSAGVSEPKDKSTKKKRDKKDDRWRLSDSVNGGMADKSYSGYVDLLVRMKSTPSNYNDRDRRNWQSTMKRIREDNNKDPNRIKIPKSDLEDWDGKY